MGLNKQRLSDYSLALLNILIWGQKIHFSWYLSTVKFFRSPGSGPGRDIQRVITSHADAAKIGRKIADEVRSKNNQLPKKLEKNIRPVNFANEVEKC